MLKTILLVLPVVVLTALNRWRPAPSRRGRYLRFLATGFAQGSVVWAAFIWSEWSPGGGASEIGWAVLFSSMVGGAFAVAYVVAARLTSPRE